MEMARFENAIMQISSGGKVNPGDYMVDGLLYCGKCHTQKQVSFRIQGRMVKSFCLCECEEENLKRQEEQERREKRERHIRYLREIAFPEKKMWEWTFDKDDGSNGRVSAISKRFVEVFPEMRERGKGLLLYGPVGTGKTFAAACIVNALIDKNIPCLMTSFARLTNILQGLYDKRQDYIDSLSKYPLLVIDDLAAERDTEYMGEIVQSVIDARDKSGLPIIVTTNLTPQELKNATDIRKQRVFSRLFEMCYPLEVPGEDRRKKKLRNEIGELRELLEAQADRGNREANV